MHLSYRAVQEQCIVRALKILSWRTRAVGHLWGLGFITLVWMCSRGGWRGAYDRRRAEVFDCRSVP
jgi:hypothetical protein